MNDTEKLADARRVFDVEIEALRRTRDALDETFVRILDLVTGCKGRVILTGMGKPGHIAAKLAATLASLGTPSFHLHPAEALHGDLGMVGPQDVVIAISYSGESEEITRILQRNKGHVDNLSIIHDELKKTFPSFDVKQYGFSRISSFIRSFGTFRIKDNMIQLRG